MAEIGETGAPKVSLTWLQECIERERAFFGDDPWPYGYQANRKTIEAFTAYSYEQGLCENPVRADSLYAEELLER
jgi:4,5-dihydroxyphthalate decarboxylase